jgi:hypothetical protein
MIIKALNHNARIVDVSLHYILRVLWNYYRILDSSTDLILAVEYCLPDNIIFCSADRVSTRLSRLIKEATFCLTTNTEISRFIDRHLLESKSDMVAVLYDFQKETITFITSRSIATLLSSNYEPIN